MTLTGSEMVLLALIVIVTLLFHKQADIARGIARLRLRFDKDIPPEYIEIVTRDDEPGD